MKALIGTIALLLLSTAAAAQTKPSLREEILAADKKLFDAFNARDITVTATMFDTSLEFYHDRSGLSGYDQTVKQLRQNFTSAMSPQRELVEGTTEVHPIPNYGAIQTGSHRFCHLENGKMDCGVFKFVHIWQKKDGNWKITRVVSYDH